MSQTEPLPDQSVQIPENAIPLGVFFGHDVWQVGVSDDGHPVEMCGRCGSRWVGVLSEGCPAASDQSHSKTED